VNDGSIPVILSIENRRVIFTIKGCVPKGKGGCDLFLYEYNLKQTILPTTIDWDGDMFTILLNIVSANGNNPLVTGNYYFQCRYDGSVHGFAFSEEVRQGIEEALPNYKIRDYKNSGHRIECKCKPDLDTDEFYIETKSAMPKPRRNFFRKKTGEWYRGIRDDFKDFGVKIYIAYFNFCNKHIKKKGNRILFASGSRAEIGGNEEFIYKRMIERGLDKDYEFRFDFKPSITKKYGLVKMLRFVYLLATSDIILIDDYYPEIYKVDYDENVKVVQVWHACGAFKALGLERMTKKGAPSLNTRVHKCYTHVPVSSYHSALHHQEAFGIEIEKFYPVGVPRTDIFFDDNYKKQTCERMYEEFPQAKKAKRVILYAPTFRGNNALDAYFPMEKFDLYKWGELCKETDSYLIVKMHPFVQEKIEIPEEYKDYIIDAADYREVNDILFITDVMITDYSSIIYEFSLLHRPMLFYAFDQNMYEASRDFYEKYEEIVPGQIVKDFDVLMDALRNEAYDTDRLDWFIEKNFTYTDGKATDRVIDMIIQ
jgi:CDP-ribitol ribitolphosphotransferase